MKHGRLLFFALLTLEIGVHGQASVDWQAVERESMEHFQAVLRFDTSAAGAEAGTDSSDTGAAPPTPVKDDSGCSLGAATPSGSPLAPLGLIIGLVCHRVRRSRRVCALRESCTLLHDSCNLA